MKRPLFLLSLIALSAGPGLPSLSAQELPAQELPIELRLPPPPAVAASRPAASDSASAPAPAPVQLAQNSRPLLQGHPAPSGSPRPPSAAAPLSLPAKPSLQDLENAPIAPLESTPTAEGPALNPGEHDGALDLLPAPGQIQSTETSEYPAPEPSAAPPVPGTNTEPAAPTDTTVPGSDLSNTPKPPTAEEKSATRGPIFRVRGTDAQVIARQRGFRFTPAQGMGRRDGIHTVASQVPNVLTSEVHGVRMMQMRPSPLWTTPYIENTFYMFCDPAYNAVRLTPGWKIRGIQIKGSDWAWVACPRSGANTASFSIRVRSWKLPDAPAQGNVVTLNGLTLEGPPGATDWKAAFPDLNKVPAVAAKR